MSHSRALHGGQPQVVDKRRQGTSSIWSARPLRSSQNWPHTWPLVCPQISASPTASGGPNLAASRPPDCSLALSRSSPISPSRRKCLGVRAKLVGAIRQLVQKGLGWPCLRACVRARVRLCAALEFAGRALAECQSSILLLELWEANELKTAPLCLDNGGRKSPVRKAVLLLARRSSSSQLSTLLSERAAYRLSIVADRRQSSRWRANKIDRFASQLGVRFVCLPAGRHTISAISCPNSCPYSAPSPLITLCFPQPQCPLFSSTHSSSPQTLATRSAALNPLHSSGPKRDKSN